MLLHIVLACLEMGIMLIAVPLWFMLPGAVFVAWACVCAAMVMGMCWMVNGKEQVYQCNAGSEGWMMGQEAEDEKWMFVGGMGMRYALSLAFPAVLPRLTGYGSAPATDTSRPSRRCRASSAGRWCASACPLTACRSTSWP